MGRQHRPEMSKDGRRDVEIRDTAERALKSTNDPAWYARYPQLVKDVASLPNATPLGSVVSPEVKVSIDANNTLYSGGFRAPGVMRLGYVPAIGVSTDITSPINVAARNIYSFVRHANSGHSNYDAPDMMMYLMAMDSMYSFYFYCRRVYGLARVYNVLNYTYPKLIFHALGVDYADIVSNLSDFRAFINTIAVKLGSLCVPTGMDIFKRHAFMCENVYTDGTSSRAQSYVFVPDKLYQYSNTGSTGTKLTATNFTVTNPPAAGSDPGITNMGVSDLKAFFDALFVPVMADEDFNIMSGDILKAFGSENILRLGLIEENFTVMPIYDETVLTQVENGKYYGFITKAVITQDPSVNAGAILTSYVGQTLRPANAWWFDDLDGNPSMLLNFHKDSVTPDEIMEATAQTVVVNSNTSGTDGSYDVVQCGADIPTFMSIFTSDGQALTWLQDNVTMLLNTSTSASALYELVRVLREYVQFDWAPHVYATLSATSGSNTTYTRGLPLTDLENAFTITESQLANVHETRMNSLFYVTQMAFGK